MSSRGLDWTKLAGLLALSTTIFGIGGAMLTGMIWPRSDVGRLAAAMLPISEVHQASADAALSSPAPSRSDLATAAKQTWLELDIAPTRAAPWLRLAFIDAVAHRGRLSDAGVQAIQHSYNFSPFDRDVGLWRLGFTYNHWDEVTPTIREAALQETGALWSGWSRRPQLERLPDFVADPAGRMAAIMAIDNLKAGADQ